MQFLYFFLLFRCGVQETFSLAGPALQLIKYLKYFIGFGIMLKAGQKTHTNEHQEKYF